MHKRIWFFSHWNFTTPTSNRNLFIFKNNQRVYLKKIVSGQSTSRVSFTLSRHHRRKQAIAIDCKVNFREVVAQKRRIASNRKYIYEKVRKESRLRSWKVVPSRKQRDGSGAAGGGPLSPKAPPRAPGACAPTSHTCYPIRGRSPVTTIAALPCSRTGSETSQWCDDSSGFSEIFYRLKKKVGGPIGPI